MVKGKLLGWIVICMSMTFAEASVVKTNSKSLKPQALLNILIQNQLQKRNPDARIELDGKIVWTRGQAPKRVSQLTFLGDNARGVARFRVNQSEFKVAYSAFLEVPVAIARITPRTRLRHDLFETRVINLARGSARIYRGNILSTTTSFHNLEARQTILPGNFVLASAVKPIPVVRRGDTVRVLIKAQGIVLSTSGRAQEEGSDGNKIRILTSATKRELSGKVLPTGSVEVVL